MSYDAIAKALYDYSAQDPEGELSFKEDQVLYIIDKEDDQ
jgi:actin cytoskeleton-regulatory complex protein SLA1